MTKDKFIVFVLLFLIIIYFSQNVLYSGGGSPIAQVSLFLILLTSVFYWIRTMLSKRRKTLFFISWTLLLLINIFGYIFTADISSSLYLNKFKEILIVLLTFYPFYYFSQRGVLKSKYLACFFLIMLPIIIAQFYVHMNEVFTRRQSVNINIVNSTAYQFVFLLPYLFLLNKRKVLSFILAFVMLFFIIQGAKRGAMISGAIGILFFAYYQLKLIEKRNRFKGFILVGIGITALVYFGYEFFLRNEYLITRLSSISEGDSSGRDLIYSNLFNAWAKSDNIINILFGYGFGSTIRLSGTGHWAHNDWLELLTNFGLMGVVIYALLFFSIIRFAFSKYCKVDKRILTLTIIAIWFITSLVSMNYNTTNGILQSILLAYLLGNKSLNLE